MANKTFSVRHGLDVANTIVIDSNRNLSNIANANVITINATNFVTSAGLNIPNHTNNAYTQANTARNIANDAYAQANNAANTVRVSQNGSSTLSSKQLNFVNTSSVSVSVTDSGDGNANIAITTSSANPGDAYNQANTARNTANDAYVQANSAFAKANAPITIKEVYAGNNTVVNTFTNINTIQFDADSGMAVVDEGTNTVTIQLNSTFKYWNINGSTGLEAFGLDTVNFIAGSGITIEANNNASPKSITFTSTGGGGSGSGPGSVRDSFTGTGACTTFTLSTNPTNENYTIVFIGGILQGDVDYNLAGNNIIFTVAPPNNTPIEVYTIGAQEIVNNKSVVYTTDGSSNTYSLGFTPANNNNILVSLDGINMIPTNDYTCSGANLTLTFLPPSNIVLEARSLQ